MKEDFSELARHFDDKLDELKQRFSNWENKILDIERKIDDLHRNKIDKNDLSNLMNLLNDHFRKADVYFQEINKIGNKIDDCERQISELSSRIK